jgi:2-phosphosulfolactate phosphatase
LRADVLPRFADVTGEDTAGRNVAVIDVFRTTTVMAVALARGAAAIYPAETVEEAREITRTLEPGSFLLAGERRGLPLEGFHLDNSPFSYTEEKIAGKTIIMTTSNGTRAVRAGADCARLYIASFLNVSAVARALIRDGGDVCIICSGTLGTFSLEDGLCAGMLLARLERAADLSLGDLGWILKHAAARDDLDVVGALRDGSLAYDIMEEAGYMRDVAYCLRSDALDILPVLGEDGMIRAGGPS